MASYTLLLAFIFLLTISFLQVLGSLPSSASKSKSSVIQRNDVQYNMVVPDAFPHWLTDVDKKFLDSTPEELRVNADIVVAKEENAQYKTVKEAVDAAPNHSKRRFIIHVKKGVYNEIVTIGTAKTNLTIIGDGRDATILTGSLNFHDGVKTFKTATLAVDGAGFMAQYICIQNTAGPAKGQAVALRVSADRSVIYRCRIEGYQDTLYAHEYRQFYRECYITGTIDFICGRASAVFQLCQIVARKPRHGNSNVITAQSRQNLVEQSGFTIQKCNITAGPDLASFKGTVKTYLGRPWGPYSTVVIMQSSIDDLVDPEGWLPRNSNDPKHQSTMLYREYNNRGAGAITIRRVNWKGYKVITDPNEAANYTVGKFLHGDLWIRSTGVPYQKGLFAT